MPAIPEDIENVADRDLKAGKKIASATAAARRERADREKRENMARIETVEALKIRCDAARKARTLAYLEMLDLIGEVPNFQRNRRQAVIAEIFGLGRAEAGRFMKFGQLDPEFRRLMIRRAVAPELIEALLRSRDDVRELALAEIEFGETLEKCDLRRLKSHLDESKPSTVMERKNRALESSAIDPARKRLKMLKDAMRNLTSLLIQLHRVGDSGDGLKQLRSEVIGAAGLRLSELEVCYGADRLGAAFDDKWRADKVLRRLSEEQHGERNTIESELRGKWSHEELMLTDTYAALRRLASGKLMPGREYDDETDRFLSRYLITPIAWYADYNLAGFEAELDELVAKNAADRAPHGEFLPDLPETRPLTSLELCAGAGGEALGLHVAKFEPLGVFEKNKSAIATLRKNYPFGALIAGDLREVDFSVYRGKVDLLAGGVPCQPHSSLGERKGDQDERDLFMTAVRIAAEVRPRAVMLENVRGFAARPGKFYVAEIMSELRKAGYSTRLFSIKASDYGLAQARPRVLLIAFRDSGLMRKFEMPPVFPQWRITVGEALRDLVGANRWPGLEDWVAKANKVGPTIVGASERSGSLAFADGYQVEAWERLGINPRTVAEEAPTEEDAPDMRPALTLAMGARLQGFPDKWEFEGSPRQKRRQIANAFPPIVAGAVGLAIRQTLTGKPVSYEAELSRLRNTPGCGQEKWWGDAYVNSRLSLRAEELGLPTGVVARDVLRPFGMRKFWLDEAKEETEAAAVAAE